MRLAHASPEVDGGPCARLSASTARLRIRPGETPVWVDAAPAARLFPRWRADAETVGMPLDGLLAARLELADAMQELGVSAQALRAAKTRLAADPARLAPPPLRPWVAVLSGSRLQEHVDELPEVVLPARLRPALDDAWWERCASVAPHTAQAWELMSAVRNSTIKELVWASSRTAARR